MMRNIAKLCIFLFIALSMAYGFYTSRLFPLTVGIGLLAILEVSIRIRTYLISSPKLDRGDLS